MWIPAPCKMAKTTPTGDTSLKAPSDVFKNEITVHKYVLHKAMIAQLAWSVTCLYGHELPGAHCLKPNELTEASRGS